MGAEAENYHDCFVRDFVPSALVFLADGEGEIVRNFLRTVLRLRSQHQRIHGHEMEPAVLPASFRVHGRVRQGAHPRGLRRPRHRPRRAGGRDDVVGDPAQHLLPRTPATAPSPSEPEVQRALRGVLELTLREGFEVFPTLLVPDGAFMIDRRMGVYGHPLEIQSLFYGMLVSAIELLRDTPEVHDLIALADKRANMLRNYVQLFYWLDMERLNEIHRYRTEEFGTGSVNMLNIYPESIPEWVVDWLPARGGYLVGNLGPGRMDFRFFASATCSPSCSASPARARRMGSCVCTKTAGTT
jgi:hypothetical protein